MSVCLLAHVRSFVRWVCVKNSLVLWVKGTDFLENNVFKCIAEGIGLIEHHSMEIWFCVWIPQGPVFCSHKSWEQLKNFKKNFFWEFQFSMHSLCRWRKQDLKGSSHKLVQSPWRSCHSMGSHMIQGFCWPSFLPQNPVECCALLLGFNKKHCGLSELKVIWSYSLARDFNPKWRVPKYSTIPLQNCICSIKVILILIIYKENADKF